ncbi:Macrophage infectivity potentiator [Diplonema papillatum]|nr:Macrophage infectivity potentiator [Diplonema papillatum]
MRVLLITVACLAATAAAGNMDKYQQRTGRKFLHEKSTEEGVHKLPSGMLMKVLKRGTGKSPGPNDQCDVHYAGTLRDGTTFDSSYDRGTPTAFAPSQVIKGWTEALQLMCEGDKWQLYIPYELAYGEQGSPPKIPGYAPLVFDVELIKVKEGGKACTEAKAKLSAELGGKSYDEL